MDIQNRFRKSWPMWHSARHARWSGYVFCDVDARFDERESDQCVP